MNKLFATIALAALAFTSCIKEDSTYKDMLPIQPGRSIYQLTMNQNTIAMRPANAALRLAMLLAEADKQELDLATAELDKVKVGNTTVQSDLFGSLTKIERQGDDYLITYSENSMLPDGLYMKGSVLVKTGGAKLLIDAPYNAPWVVEMKDLKVIAYADQGTTQTFNLNSGRTTLYYEEGGLYMIDVEAFQANIDNVDASSNWSGNFNLRAEDSSLAYSTCSGKDFKIEGEASGPTVYSSETTKSVGMSYELENGVFRGTQILSGTQICSFTSYFEYDTAAYPSSTVTYEWTYDSAANRIYQKIYYNGYVYPKD